LRDDFGLNPPGMALALAYLERIDELERRLRELECQLLR
jgi:chaperone modulatory protein CbpM